jgi:hypothetical protein
MTDDTHEPFPCVDCGVDTTPPSGPSEYYMVKSRIWDRTGLAFDGGALCIGCLETRLGRRLRPQDFNRTTFKWMAEHSARLRSRLESDAATQTAASGQHIAVVGNWAVADDGLQWILQRQHGGRWRNVSFVRSDQRRARSMPSGSRGDAGRSNRPAGSPAGQPQDVARHW